MANGSNVVTLGPFMGGLNNYQDASSLQDEELHQLVNYEVEPGGSLITRPGITVNPSGITWGTGGGANASLLPNGTPVNPIAVGRYKSASGAAMLYKEINGDIYVERMNNAADTVITPSMRKIEGLSPGRKRNVCMVQYNDRMYVSNQSNKDAIGYTRVGFTDFTKIASMPPCENMFVHKERIFAIPGKHTSAATGSSLNRIYFTPVLYNGGDWNIAENFINIGGGDGEYITNGLVYLGDILFFKDSSTWRFTYEADIGGGTLEKISDVGTVGSRSVVKCNDRIYTFYNDNLYEIFNYQWRKLSGGIKFLKKEIRPTDSYAEDVSLGYLGDRIIVSYYGNTYVYSQGTGTWTTWESSFEGFGRMLPVSGSYLDHIDNDILIAGYYKNTNYKANNAENRLIHKLYRIEDTNQPISTVNAANYEAEEQYECRFTTKIVDLGAGSAFKRLMWWGLDALIKTKVQSTATVIVNNAGYTWDDLSDKDLDKWEESTCDNLTSVFPRAVNNVEMYSSDLSRRFIKFLQGLRFRQVQFDFNTTVDGTADTVPHKVYALTLVIKGKTKMSEQVS